jgi:hypothetical protein
LAVLGDENIRALDVPMDHALRMQIVQAAQNLRRREKRAMSAAGRMKQKETLAGRGKNKERATEILYLGNIESQQLLRKDAKFLHQHMQRASLHVLQYEEQRLLRGSRVSNVAYLACVGAYLILKVLQIFDNVGMVELAKQLQLALQRTMNHLNSERGFQRHERTTHMIDWTI